MRISDWSSDVCSSDLRLRAARRDRPPRPCPPRLDHRSQRRRPRGRAGRHHCERVRRAPPCPRLHAAHAARAPQQGGVMDPATGIGMALAFAFFVIANVLEGGNPMHMLMLPPMLLVFGGTIGVTIAGGTMAAAKTAVKSHHRTRKT